MSKITDSARGKECTIRIPEVCNRDSSTTVFCHIAYIRFGHGTGIKTQFGAYGCSSCHDAIDGRSKTAYSKDQLKLMHLEGVIETLSILNNIGLINLQTGGK